jgi:hypothetical protein
MPRMLLAEYDGRLRSAAPRDAKGPATAFPLKGPGGRGGAGAEG